MTSMSPVGVDPPEVLKRRLRTALRQAREQAKITQRAAAERLYWSPSKIIRIEQGNVPVAPSDVRVLLLEYGVGEERVLELVELAKASRRPDEWAAYKDVFSSAARELFANERAAEVVQKFEPSLIPGLLQTEAYARALLKALGTPHDVLSRKLEVRIRRQEMLDSPNCPELDFIIGEATVSRPVGGKHVMIEQIEWLKEVARHQKVTLQLLPFAAGAHPGLGCAFTLLQFVDPDLPDLLYLEGADKESITRDDRQAIERYGERFVELKDLCSPDDLDGQLEEIARYRFGS